MARRAQWGRQAEFVLTLVGYTVGFSNVLRFPYLCYRNGGVAFLIPYLVCLVCLGIPVFGLEIFLGQYGGRGPLSIWTINPVAKGVGFGLVAVSGISMIYNSVLISWAVRYLIASFATFLPWKECRSCSCVMYDPTGLWQLNSRCSETSALSPSEAYFNEEVLNVSKDIRETGGVQWEIMLCNMVCWVIVFVVLCRGIRSLGKVSYVTGTLPFLLLTILVIRASLLDGAEEGIRHYLKPDWDRLADVGVWVEAALQVIFSLGLSTGALIAMSSYNHFNNNIIRDALLVPIIDTVISLYAGFLVFAILGYMAHVKNTTVDAVTVAGPGLAFIIFPEAVAQMPVSPLWAVFFFAMLCMLGFSSQFATVETFVTAFVDESSKLASSAKRSLIFRGGVCVGAFLLGMPMVTRSGPLLLEIVDRGLYGIPVLNGALFQLLVVGIIYGVDHFMEDVQCMVGRKPNAYFKVCWMVLCPLMLVGASIFMVFTYRPHPVPLANLTFWLISIFPVFCIPAFALIYSCKASPMTSATRDWWNLRNRGTATGSDLDKAPSAKNNNMNGYDQDVPERKDSLHMSSEDGVINEVYNLDGGFCEEFSPPHVTAVSSTDGGTSGHGGQMTRM